MPQFKVIMCTSYLFLYSKLIIWQYNTVVAVKYKLKNYQFFDKIIFLCAAFNINIITLFLKTLKSMIVLKTQTSFTTDTRLLLLNIQILTQSNNSSVNRRKKNHLHVI